MFRSPFLFAHRWRVALAAALAAVALGLALWLAQGGSQTSASAGQQGVIYRGTIGYTSDLSTYPYLASGGGTIAVTLTDDRSRVLRVDVEGLQSTAPLQGVTFRFSRELYFDPPVALTGGSFEVHLPGLLFGMVRDSATVQAHLEPDDTLSGSVQWGYRFLLGGSTVFFPAAPWTAAPGQAPPAPDDAVHVAAFTGHDGSLSYTTNANGEVTSVDIKVANLTPCFPAERAFNLHFIFEPAASLAQGSIGKLISDPTSGLLPPVSFSFAGGGTSGDFTIGAGFYLDDCRVTLQWATLAATPTPTATPIPIPRFQTFPAALQNMFLTRQGTKIPPSRCVDGSNYAGIAWELSVPLTGPDPKDPSQPQQLGGFSFQLKYDPLKVCIDIVPAPAWTQNPQQVCTVEDSVSAPALQGIARINCVTLGKATVIDTISQYGRTLAAVYVRPQPEAYSQIIPNQDNGQAVQLNAEACKLTDLQGHPIEVFSCEDTDVTIRFLEGDVEPDCQVNTLDTQAMAFRWGATKGVQLYTDRFNLEPSIPRDQDIDVNDLQFVYGRFGSTCYAPWPPQPPVNPKA